MNHPYTNCPICNTPNHHTITVCATCGATLNITTKKRANKGNPSNYKNIQGETDLAENTLPSKNNLSLLTSIITFAAISCISAAIILISRPTEPTNPSQQANIPITSTESLKNTPRQTLILATITPGPPTNSPSPSSTITPTEGPCSQTVEANDDLISILFRCGHREIEPILSTVVAENNLINPSSIQQGQTILVPWPTPTGNPSNATEASTNETSSATSTSSNFTQESALNIPIIPSETLQPGVTWHTIQKDENIIIIAVEYGATLRILSDLNPELTFSQCDFGQGTGGPTCVVQIVEGQKIRVPAPTPTPTIPPTASGSETPTPTATPTFNAPSLISPSNNAFFDTSTLITLRWISTGTLSENDAYLIHIEDRTVNKIYSDTTRALSYIVPQEWQGSDNTRHEYLWSVSVINLRNPNDPYFTTETRTFTWQGQNKN